MKKITFLLSISACIAFTSCKKSYDCSCTTEVTTVITQSLADTTVTVVYNNNKKVEAGSKKKAQTTCDEHKRNLENEYGNFQFSTYGYSSTSATSCTMTRE